MNGPELKIPEICPYGVTYYSSKCTCWRCEKAREKEKKELNARMYNARRMGGFK